MRPLGSRRKEEDPIKKSKRSQPRGFHSPCTGPGRGQPFVYPQILSDFSTFGGGPPIPNPFTFPGGGGLSIQVCPYSQSQRSSTRRRPSRPLTLPRGGSVCNTAVHPRNPLRLPIGGGYVEQQSHHPRTISQHIPIPQGRQLREVSRLLSSDPLTEPIILGPFSPVLTRNTCFGRAESPR
jgi:hypothetical protein